MNIFLKLKNFFGLGRRHDVRSLPELKIRTLGNKSANDLDMKDGLQYYKLIVEMVWLQDHIQVNTNRKKGSVVSIESNALNRLLNEAIKKGIDAMDEDESLPVKTVLKSIVLFYNNLKTYGFRMKEGKRPYYDEVFVKLKLIEQLLIYFGVDPKFLCDTHDNMADNTAKCG